MSNAPTNPSLPSSVPLEAISAHLRQQATLLEALQASDAAGSQVAALLQAVTTIDQFIATAHVHDGSQPVSISDCLAAVNTEVGRQRLHEHLASRPFPHYEQVAGDSGLYVQVLADGTRQRGRFVGREFRTVD